MCSRLLAVAAALGESALRPSAGDPEARRKADALLSDLATLASLPADDDGLAGTWRLAYASDGTVVTRVLPTPVTITGVRQTLRRVGERSWAVDNRATLAVPLLGSVELSVSGDWVTTTSTAGLAQVSFSELGLGGVSLAVPELLRRAAEFRTLYCDDRVRISEGVRSQNRFVFERVL